MLALVKNTNTISLWKVIIMNYHLVNITKEFNMKAVIRDLF